MWKKNINCKFFLRSGCYKGASCEYVHDKSLLAQKTNDVVAYHSKNSCAELIAETRSYRDSLSVTESSLLFYTIYNQVEPQLTALQEALSSIELPNERLQLFKTCAGGLLQKRIDPCKYRKV